MPPGCAGPFDPRAAAPGGRLGAVNDRMVVRASVPDRDMDVALDVLWRHEPSAVAESGGVPGGAVLEAGYPSAAAAARATDELERRGIAATAQRAGLRPDWLSAWRDREPRHRIGELVIHLPEHPRPTGGVAVEIEPADAFGFGHPSTGLALALLASIPLRGASVVDIGCGTGVLAVAAARLGAAGVRAVDVDERAVAVTRDNARRNRVCVDAVAGSVERLAGSRADVVAANLGAATIAELADALSALLAPGGHLVLSGLLTRQGDETRARFPQLRLVESLTDGDWLALRLRA